jgi:hypothetical protein
MFEHAFSAQVSGTPDKQGNVRIKVILMRFRETIFVVGKQLLVHVLSVSLALVIQHVKRVRHIVIVVRSL